MGELGGGRREPGIDRRLWQRRKASDPGQSATGRDRRGARDRRRGVRRTDDRLRTDTWQGEELETPPNAVGERRRERRTRLSEPSPVEVLPGGRALLVDISPRGMMAAHPFPLRPGQPYLVRVAANGHQCAVQAVARRSALTGPREFPGLAKAAPGSLVYQTGLEVLNPPPSFASIYTLLATGSAGTA